MKIVFFGNADFGIPGLERLFASAHPVAAVVTNPDKPQGRGRELESTPIKQKALALKIPMVEAEDLSADDLYGKLVSLGADLFVVIAFRILPERIFTLPAQGTINLHASLLPKYRGAAPIHWALINGEKKTGVSTFFIEKKVDTGGIILQKETEIKESESYGELYQRLSQLGAEVVLETVDLIATGNVKVHSQDSSQASPAPKITKEMCKIEWNQDARKIFNLVRGLSPHPGAHTDCRGKLLKIIQADYDESNFPLAHPGEITSNDPDQGFRVQTQNGQLRLIMLQLEGKKVLTAQEFLRGYHLKLGEKLGADTSVSAQ